MVELTSEILLKCGQIAEIRAAGDGNEGEYGQRSE